MILKLKCAELSVLCVGVERCCVLCVVVGVLCVVVGRCCVLCVGVGRCYRRVLSVTFGPETDDGTGECSELQNEKFGDGTSVLTAYWGNEVRGDQMDRACDATGRAEIHTEFWYRNLKGRDKVVL